MKNIFYGIGGLLSGISMFIAVCMTVVIFAAYSCVMAMSASYGEPVEDGLLSIMSIAVAVVALFAMLIALIISIRGFCGGNVKSAFVIILMILHLVLVAASIYFALPEIEVSAQLTGSFVFFIVFAVINVICITLYVLGMVRKKQEERQDEEMPQEEQA